MAEVSERTVNVRYMVDDVDAAVAFYTTHLGFSLLSSAAPAFADVVRGDPGALGHEPAGLLELAAGEQQRDRVAEVAADDRKEPQVLVDRLSRLFASSPVRRPEHLNRIGLIPVLINGPSGPTCGRRG